jgi:hypothetical protein
MGVISHRFCHLLLVGPKCTKGMRLHEGVTSEDRPPGGGGTSENFACPSEE